MNTRARDFASFYFGGYNEVHYCAGPVHGVDTLQIEFENITMREQLTITAGERPTLKAFSREITPDGKILRNAAKNICDAIPMLIDDIEWGKYTHQFYEALKDYYIRNTRTIAEQSVRTPQDDF